MNKVEVNRFLKKVKAYYPYFSLEDYVIEEWEEKLEPYSKEDVLKKFDEHLNGEYALEPPKLHFITKYLNTEEAKQRYGEDYIVRCDLCGKQVYLTEYNTEHRDKCLLIKALIPVLTKRGENVTYESLDSYDFKTLDRIYEKYVPITKNIDELLQRIGDKE